MCCREAVATTPMARQLARLPTELNASEELSELSGSDGGMLELRHLAPRSLQRPMRGLSLATAAPSRHRCSPELRSGPVGPLAAAESQPVLSPATGQPIGMRFSGSTKGIGTSVAARVPHSVSTAIGTSPPASEVGSQQ